MKTAIILLIGFFLQRQESDIQTIIDSWRNSDITAREKAYRDLVERWEKLTEKDLALLSGAKDDPDEEVSMRTRDALLEISIYKSIGMQAIKKYPKLLKIIKNGSSKERVSFLTELQTMSAQIGKKGTASICSSFLKFSDKAVVANTLARIGKLKIKSLNDEVLALLKDKDPAVRACAVSVLAITGTNEHAKAIAKLLTDKTIVESSNLPASEIIDNQNNRFFIPNLNDYRVLVFDDEGHNLGNSQVRCFAARALGWIKAVEYEKEVAEMVDDGNTWVKIFAVNALGNMASKKFKDKLVKLRDRRDNPEDSFEVSYFAESALRSIEDGKQIDIIYSDEELG